MVDRDFKIKNDLAMKQYKLCIPPSPAKKKQMLSKDEIGRASCRERV